MFLLEEKNLAPKFFIKLGQGFNGFKWGTNREVIRKKLGNNYYTKDTKTIHKDIYSTCHVIYCPKDTLMGIQLFKKCVVLLDGKKLDFDDYKSAISWLKDKDKNCAKSNNGIISKKLGIKISFDSNNKITSVYIVPTKDVDKEKINKY